MTKTIWKFPLQVADEQIVQMPKNAEILTIQAQKGDAYLWAIVNPDNALEDRIILCRGTGHEIQSEFNIKYISTCQFYEGDIIFHYFERIPI